MTLGRWLQYGVLTVLLALAGCGGSSSGSSTAEGGMGGSGSGSGEYAEGGMGGSGSGTTSGYGSIKLNDDRRHYPIDDNADVFLDGVQLEPGSINPEHRGLPLGMSVEFLLAGDANADLTQGTAIRIVANHRVIGPVTGTEPLEVLGQPVLVTSETMLAEPLTTSAVENLAVGDLLKVDGLVNGTGVIRATRLEAPALVPAEWQLIGRVTASATDSLTVGGDPALSLAAQKVSTVNATLEDCASAAPATGGRVLVRAMADSGFQPGDTLANTLSIRCLPEGLSLFAQEPPEERETLPATVDAIITGLPDLEDVPGDLAGGDIALDLDGQIVVVNLEQLDELLFGTLEQLKLGSRIEVDGSLDTNTGVITAERIRFRDPLITLTAPVEGGILDRLLLTLGIEVRPTPGMTGDVGFDVLDTLGQVAVEGFITEDGVIHAEHITDAGTADLSSVSFTGPVTGVEDSLESVTLQTGRIFDATSATEISLLDATGDLIGDALCGILDLLISCNSPPEELNQVPQDGSAVGAISDATWDGTGFSDGKLEITLPPGSER